MLPSLPLPVLGCSRHRLYRMDEVPHRRCPVPRCTTIFTCQSQTRMVALCLKLSRVDSSSKRAGRVEHRFPSSRRPEARVVLSEAPHARLVKDNPSPPCMLQNIIKVLIVMSRLALDTLAAIPCTSLDNTPWKDRVLPLQARPIFTLGAHETTR